MLKKRLKKIVTVVLVASMILIIDACNTKVAYAGAKSNGPGDPGVVAPLYGPGVDVKLPAPKPAATQPVQTKEPYEESFHP